MGGRDYSRLRIASDGRLADQLIQLAVRVEDAGTAKVEWLVDNVTARRCDLPSGGENQGSRS